MAKKNRSPYARDSKYVKSITRTTRYGQKVEVTSEKSRFAEDKKFNPRYVNSSNINKIGFKKKELILRIWFLGGGVYDYFDVEQKTYQRLLNAPSKGKYFHKNIKGKYVYKKVI